ncbi:membrane protein DedA with SNARE-associated domain [Rhizobium sp. PP-F2F-G48]|uniref:DedA family protein n=1 Tax=Rhizobium sp. PP-F2F-G48 TaxID=2135651 RepID=UPI001046B80B|nr:VTT domain-containing protein [Rhizobium sp. PP-F2F-G48]TCM52562.1 membrane protein DedA with SNARE-associated domain [Rhizobium sp. PP-F2F-G48]
MNIDIIGAWMDALLDAVDLKTVFLASVLEKFIPLLPSYVLFPAIGAGASTVEDLIVKCLIAASGSLCAALAWYGVGVAVGEQRVRSVVERYGKWLLLKTSLYEQMSSSYRNNPFMITVLGQMVPTVRIFHALPAGVLRLPLAKFLVASALGSLMWVSILAGCGYALHLQGWSVSETGAGLLVVLIVTEGVGLTVVVTVNRLRKHLSTKRGTTAVAMRGRWCLSIMQDARLQPSFLRKSALSAFRK